MTNGQWRMLATWHTHIFFADGAHDKALKRLMRDHVHYRADLVAIAARGVDELGACASVMSAVFPFSPLKVMWVRDFAYNAHSTLRNSEPKPSLREARRLFPHLPKEV